MTRALPPALAELALFQGGVLTAAQGQAAGLSRSALRSRAEVGGWQRLHSGVYFVFTGLPDRNAVLWAAVLRGGPGAMLSYHSAAELAGLTDTPLALVHVTVPSSRHPTRIGGVVLHQSEQAGRDRHPAHAPPRTRIEATVLDLGQAEQTAEQACGWVLRALGRRLTTADRLQAALAQRYRQRWRGDIAGLLTAAYAGVHSGLEFRYARDVERPHGLPAGVRQVKVQRGRRILYRDVLYREFATVVELDGRLAHPDEAKWRDMARDNAAAAAGLVTLRYGWADVSQQPCDVAAQVIGVLRGRGFSDGKPCSPRCPVSRVLIRPSDGSVTPRARPGRRAG